MSWVNKYINILIWCNGASHNRIPIVIPLIWYINHTIDMLIIA